MIRTDLEHMVVALGRLPEAIALYNRRTDEWRRGGLPSRSMGESSKSAERPLPMRDTIDRRIDYDTRAIEAALRRAQQDLEGALRQIDAWIIPAEAIPEPTSQSCNRLGCNRTVSNIGNDRLITSPVDALRVCRKCYNHERTNGLPWPKKRETAA